MFRLAAITRSNIVLGGLALVAACSGKNSRDGSAWGQAGGVSMPGSGGGAMGGTAGDSQDTRVSGGDVSATGQTGGAGSGGAANFGAGGTSTVAQSGAGSSGQAGVASVGQGASPSSSVAGHTSMGLGGTAAGGRSGSATGQGGASGRGQGGVRAGGSFGAAGAGRGGSTGGQSGAAGTASGGSSAGSSGFAGTSSGNDTCLGAALLSSLGKTTLLVGAAMDDATANLAPFDGRYLYLSGGFFDGAEPCSSCATGCTSQGTSCANTAGCGWWGCWQWDQDPPGQYVVSFVSTTSAATFGSQPHPQIPMFTYYEVLQASGVSEGAAEVAAMNNEAFLHRYFADFRLVLQKIGSSRALLHLEPDFWGYVEQSGSDPHAMPAPVTSANPRDCPGAENSVSGVARCMIAMVRKYSANARVGLHASGWGTNMDALSNSSPSFDVVSEGRKLGNYLVALGAAEGDFLVADMSDRDAGYYQKQGRSSWWDPTNATLPNFHQAFTWAKSVSDVVKKPIIWWQIPVGNMNQSDTTNHYRDNRVDYLFAHLDEVVASNGIGLFFGAGEGQQTTPETDGGNLVAKVKAYASAPQPVCP